MSSKNGGGKSVARNSEFVGALHGKRAQKGVFITTGRFSEEAIDVRTEHWFKNNSIDGRALSEYMIDFNLGTSTAAKYEVKEWIQITLQKSS